MNFEPNYPLSGLTTFHLGGPARFFCQVTNLAELDQALNFAQEKSLPILALGNGSNILVSDQGFNGLVIHNQIKGLKIEDSGLTTVGAGENWDDVVSQTVAKDLAGVECLSGVPGSAGGALVHNIGAYGQTLGDVVVEVQAVEVTSRQAKVFSPGMCELSYRNSFFKKNPNTYIVTGFSLRLSPGGVPTIAYPHVKKHFENKPAASLSDLRQFIIKIRASKGYLIMPGYESYNTAGSFFKNPIITQEQFQGMKPQLGEIVLNRYWETPNGVKLAAAFLMEEAGFAKGYREGNVGISPKHSLSLVNFGGASATEVKTLADKIKKVILEKFGVTLEEEILYV